MKNESKIIKQVNVNVSILQSSSNTEEEGNFLLAINGEAQRGFPYNEHCDTKEGALEKAEVYIERMIIAFENYSREINK